MNIRKTSQSDREALVALHHAAFAADEGPSIVRLVEAMLADKTAEPRLSLVAERDGRVAGHIVFTRAEVETSASLSDRILAPLAVSPEVQRRGIGGALIRNGLARLRADGVGLVFVYGDPNYYTRHGFEPAMPHGLMPPHELPERYCDAWMVHALQPQLLGQVTGKLRCADTLMPAEHWIVPED